MLQLFSATQVIISVVVILLVLLHSGKDAGLSGAFGVGTGAGPFGGGSLVERNLDRWTIFFAILFVANVIVLLKVIRRSSIGRVTRPSSMRNVPSRVTPVTSVSFSRTGFVYQRRVT